MNHVVSLMNHKEYRGHEGNALLVCFVIFVVPAFPVTDVVPKIVRQ